MVDYKERAKHLWLCLDEEMGNPINEKAIENALRSTCEQAAAHAGREDTDVLLQVMGSLTQFLRLSPDDYKTKKQREWGWNVIDRAFHQIDEHLRRNDDDQ